ncbi:MAG: hypothetical protein ACE5LF_01815 [Alphaproteobacteria bacterium]
MRKQQPPWSVRGISQEARAKAAKAAARRRMTIGEWVNTALITVANSELGSGTANPSAAAGPATGEAAGGALQVKPEGSPELVEAIETLTRQIEQNGASEKAVTTLVERLDSLARTDETMTAFAGRFAELDRRDRTLLALAERLVGNEEKNEQRLVTLASAINVLAGRLNVGKRTGGSGVTPEILACTLAPLKTAIDDLVSRVNGGPRPAEPLTAIEPAIEPAAAKPEQARGDDAAETKSYPMLDYEILNEHAIDNTRRLDDDELRPERKGGLFSRLLGGG